MLGEDTQCDELVHTYIAEMFTTVKLVKISFTAHNYHFVVVMVRNFSIYSHSNIQIYSTVLLTVVTMVYIRSLERTCFVSGGLYLLTKVFRFPPQPSISLLCFRSTVFSDPTY